MRRESRVCLHFIALSRTTWRCLTCECVRIINILQPLQPSTGIIFVGSEAQIPIEHMSKYYIDFVINPFTLV